MAMIGFCKLLIVKDLQHKNEWWNRQGSNLRPGDYESPALTTELRFHKEEQVVL